MSLNQERQQIYTRLKSYSTLEESKVQKLWKYTGIAGGHRSYLGDEKISLMMALTFGGLGFWWFKDKQNIPQLVQDWNQEQLRRQRANEAPNGLDGLVLVSPNQLDGDPIWINEEPSSIENGIDLMFKWPLMMVIAMQNMMKAFLTAIPIIGRIYAPFFIVIEWIYKKYLDNLEAIYVVMLTYTLGLVMGGVQLYEPLLLLVGICFALGISDFLQSRPDSFMKRLTLEWDYLILSYYHKERPKSFFYSYVVSGLKAYPMLLGIGVSEGEKALYSRLSGYAALACVIFLPLDIVEYVFSGGTEGLIQAVLLNFYIELMGSIFIVGSIVPAIGGTISKYKLLKEKAKTRIITFSSVIALVAGFISGIFIEF